MGDEKISVSKQLSLTIEAHEVADDLYTDSEEDGVTRPALFQRKRHAVLFGMAMGLAAGEKAEGKMKTFTHINSLQEEGDLDLSSLIHLIGNEEDRLNPVKALGEYASWGLCHLKNYYLSGANYELSKVAQILNGPISLCNGCGAMIGVDDSLDRCPRCGILFD